MRNSPTKFRHFLKFKSRKLLNPRSKKLLLNTPYFHTEIHYTQKETQKYIILIHNTPLLLTYLFMKTFEF